jgi:hypothetical protein
MMRVGGRVARERRAIARVRFIAREEVAVLPIQRLVVCATAVALAATLACPCARRGSGERFRVHEDRHLLLRRRRLKATIATKVERFRQVLAEQRKMGKAVGY